MLFLTFIESKQSSESRFCKIEILWLIFKAVDNILNSEAEYD